MSRCIGRIAFIGLGLQEGHITLRAAEALREADLVYLEEYTSFYYPEPILALEKIGVRREKIFRLSRKDLEESSGEKILKEALVGKAVALAVIGDPYIATTHLALKLHFMQRGCQVEYIPSVNIFSYSVSATGLFQYKFGESATIVYPKDGIISIYPYLVLEENRRRGLHTFFFLDIDEKLGPLSAAEAIKLLMQAEGIEKRKAFSEDIEVVVVERASWPDERIIAGRAGELMEMHFNPPDSLIVPGKLHFMEKEALEVYRK
ncbi:MAG: diphthine synthase [Fervidicoccaceae archaeon]